MDMTEAVRVEEAVLNMLQRYEVLAMEDLIVGRPDFSWAQIFLATDRLSRKNVIALHRTGLSYQLRLSTHGQALCRRSEPERTAAHQVS